MKIKFLAKCFVKSSVCRTLELRETLYFSDGNNFPNQIYYIRAAAGRSIWNRSFSQFSACGFFIPSRQQISSYKNCEK